MMIPVRCFSCGKVVADKYYEFREEAARIEHTKKEGDVGKILDKLGYERYCCRRMVLSQEELIDDINPYPRY
jgi:DNA-directed RNA polymerase subunit N